MTAEHAAHRIAPHPKQAAQLGDKRMAYVELGRGDDGPAFLFLHGNPTSSYLWRDVMPGVAALGRCRTEATVRGSHFIQEDCGPEIGRAIAGWAAGLARG